MSTQDTTLNHPGYDPLPLLDGVQHDGYPEAGL